MRGVGLGSKLVLFSSPHTAPQTATHTLITGLEEYVRESFVSNPSPSPPLLALVRIAHGSQSLRASDLGVFVCFVSQSLVQVQPGVDIIRTNLEFLQEQFNSIAAHVMHCTGQGLAGPR